MLRWTRYPARAQTREVCRGRVLRGALCAMSCFPVSRDTCTCTCVRGPHKKNSFSPRAILPGDGDGVDDSHCRCGLPLHLLHPKRRANPESAPSGAASSGGDELAAADVVRRVPEAARGGSRACRWRGASSSSATASPTASATASPTTLETIGLASSSASSAAALCDGHAAADAAPAGPRHRRRASSLRTCRAYASSSAVPGHAAAAADAASARPRRRRRPGTRCWRRTCAVYFTSSAAAREHAATAGTVCACAASFAPSAAAHGVGHAAPARPRLWRRPGSRCRRRTRTAASSAAAALCDGHASADAAAAGP